MTLAFCDETVADFAIDMEFDLQTKPAYSTVRNECTGRRVNSLCMGLLEARTQTILESSPGSRSINYVVEVDYLHRTVHDFLMSPDSQQLLFLYTAGRFDTTRYLLDSYSALAAAGCAAGIRL